MGSALDGVIQMIFLAWDDKNKDLSITELAEKTDKAQMARSGAEAMVNQAGLAAVFSCVSDGLMKGGSFKENITFEDFGKDCVTGAGTSLTADLLLKTPALKKKFDRLVKLGKENPGRIIGLLKNKFKVTDEVAEVILKRLIKISDKQAALWIKARGLRTFVAKSKEGGENIVVYAKEGGKKLAEMTKDGVLKINKIIDDFTGFNTQPFGKFQLAAAGNVPEDIVLVTSKKDKDGIFKILGFGKGGGKGKGGKIPQDLYSILGGKGANIAKLKKLCDIVDDPGPLLNRLDKTGLEGKDLKAFINDLTEAPELRNKFKDLTVIGAKVKRLTEAWKVLYSAKADAGIRKSFKELELVEDYLSRQS